ncbi:hypothetical protein BaRGS_00040107, partial [Batillaria attramentaria]
CSCCFVPVTHVKTKIPQGSHFTCKKTKLLNSVICTCLSNTGEDHISKCECTVLVINNRTDTDTYWNEVLSKSMALILL